ncbi:hypothetical protein P148_SR1C00001G0442 [candidate division SR1 bacterium RAAC1_SR1_1]|nr:hypothetical protein P148_SR1C00001G0442 [candidate division SR1 bacterium RAAC1_SR1_1]
MTSRETGSEVKSPIFTKKRTNFFKPTKKEIKDILEETPKQNGMHNFTQDITPIDTIPTSMEEIKKAIDVCIINDAENISVDSIEDRFPNIEDEFPEGEGWKTPIEKYIKNYRKLLVRIKETLVNDPQIIDKYGSVFGNIIDEGQKKREIKPDQIAILLEFIFKYNKECYLFTQDDIINVCIEQSDNKLLNTIIFKN